MFTMVHLCLKLYSKDNHMTLEQLTQECRVWLQKEAIHELLDNQHYDQTEIIHEQMRLLSESLATFVQQHYDAGYKKGFKVATDMSKHGIVMEVNSDKVLHSV